MLVLESSLLGTFLSQNAVLFFVFWEAVLIPAGVLILVYGGEQRRRAAITFFLYTMAGSVLLLAAVIALGVEALTQTGKWSFELGCALWPAPRLEHADVRVRRDHAGVPGQGSAGAVSLRGCRSPTTRRRRRSRH